MISTRKQGEKKNYAKKNDSLIIKDLPIYRFNKERI